MTFLGANFLELGYLQNYTVGSQISISHVGASQSRGPQKPTDPRDVKGCGSGEPLFELESSPFF